MNNDFVLIVVSILIIGIGGFAALSFTKYTQAQVQIACYDAMKHNPNIKECGNIK
jgi:hypothetical protein